MINNSNWHSEYTNNLNLSYFFQENAGFPYPNFSIEEMHTTKPYHTMSIQRKPSLKKFLHLHVSQVFSCLAFSLVVGLDESGQSLFSRIFGVHGYFPVQNPCIAMLTLTMVMSTDAIPPLDASPSP
jgi:hypothetical protein